MPLLLHTLHHSVAARCAVSVIALVGLYVLGMLVEYTFCGS